MYDYGYLYALMRQRIEQCIPAVIEECLRTRWRGSRDEFTLHRLRRRLLVRVESLLDELATKAARDIHIELRRQYSQKKE